MLLPSPRVRASDVRVVVGEADYPANIDAKHVELDLGWASLFGGAVEITHLRVIEPRVVFTEPRAGAATPVPQLGPIEAVRIERTDIQNGRIVWVDPRSKAPRTVEQIQAVVLASPLASSIRVTGTAVARAVPLEFDAVVGDAPVGRPNPFSLTASIRPNLARATLRGTYDAGARALRGRLQAEGGDLLAALDVVGIQIDSAAAGPMSQPFSATGDLGWSAGGIAANDVVLQLGEVRATGAVNATFGQTPAIDVALALAWIDLDKLSRLERRAPAAQRPAPRPANGATTRVDTAATPRERAAEKILDLSLDLGIEALGLNGGIVRQLRLNAVMSRGDLVINQASALLPGGTELTGFARIDADAQPARIEGTVSARSDNMRGLLGWLGIDTSEVPAGRLRRFESQARVEGTPSRIELTGFNLVFDSTHATGGIAIAPGARIGLGIDLKIDQINIDGYSAAPAQSGQPAGASSPALLDRFDANLALAAETMTVGGETISGAVLDATLQRGDVVLRSLEIRDLAGAQVEMRGQLAAVTRQAAADLQISLRADDASRLLRLVDLTAAAPTPLALAGRLTGQAGGDIAFDDVDLAYGTSRFRGRAQLTQKPARRVLLDLQTERVSLDSFAHIVADDDASLGVDAIVQADAIEFGPHEIGKARLEAHVDGDMPSAVDLTGTAYDGALEVTLRSEGPGRGKLNGTASLRNADLSRALVGLDRCQGDPWARRFPCGLLGAGAPGRRCMVRPGGIARAQGPRWHHRRDRSADDARYARSQRSADRCRIPPRRRPAWRVDAVQRARRRRDGPGRQAGRQHVAGRDAGRRGDRGRRRRSRKGHARYVAGCAGRRPERAAGADSDRRPDRRSARGARFLAASKLSHEPRRAAGEARQPVASGPAGRLRLVHHDGAFAGLGRCR